MDVLYFKTPWSVLWVEERLDLAVGSVPIMDSHRGSSVSGIR